MATYYSAANQELGAAYDPAAAQLATQPNDIAQLYSALSEGLGAQAQQGTQAVVDSAARRGVLRAGLAGDVGATLQGDVDLGRAQLIAAKMAELADVQKARAALAQGRAINAGQLGGTLQEKAQAKGKYNQDVKLSNQKYNLEVQKLLRDAELAKTQKAYSDAHSGGGGGYGYGPSSGSSSGGGNQPQSNRDYYNSALASIAGKDGHVNPVDYYTALHSWQAAGGSRAEFNKTFSKYRNPADAKKGAYKGL